MHKLLLILLLTLLPTAAFSTTNYDPGVNGNIGGAQVTSDTPYTPTFSAGFGTPTSISFVWSRVGDKLHVHGTFTNGTVAGSVGTITLPSGLSIDSAKYLATSSSSPSPQVGSAQSASADQFGPILVSTSSNTDRVYTGAKMSSGTPLTPGNVNNLFGSTQLITVDFWVAISGWSAGGAGGATLPNCTFRFSGGNGHGSTNDAIRRFTTKIEPAGNDCTDGSATYADSATAGMSITINTVGTYCGGNKEHGSGSTGWTLNSSQLTTSIASVTDSTILDEAEFSAIDGKTSWCKRLSAGDVVRVHDSKSLTGSTAFDVRAWLTKVSN